MLKKGALVITVLMVMVIFTATAFAEPVKVNINTADAKTLAKNIKGVGAKKAKAIVQYREQNGPFQTVDDLTKVKNIGKSTVDKNRDILTTGE